METGCEFGQSVRAKKVVVIDQNDEISNSGCKGVVCCICDSSVFIVGN